LKKLRGSFCEFEFATKNKILIVIKHPILVLVAHSYRGRDRDFENARAALSSKRTPEKFKAFDDPVNDRVSTFPLALNTQTCRDG